MLRDFALGALGCVIVSLVACSEGTDGAGKGSGANKDDAGADAASSTGGKSSSSAGGADGSGGSQSAGGASGAGSSASGSGGFVSAGGAGSSGGAPSDAATDQAASDATADVDPAPVCLGVGETCGLDGGATCCPAYGCRNGKCCTPNGVWSNCLTNSDCCSNSCVLGQCTCVPLGYSCNGGGCCSGYSCVNGTCICPPDIRGCN